MFLGVMYPLVFQLFACLFDDSSHFPFALCKNISLSGNLHRWWTRKGNDTRRRGWKASEKNSRSLNMNNRIALQRLGNDGQRYEKGKGNDTGRCCWKLDQFRQMEEKSQTRMEGLDQYETLTQLGLKIWLQVWGFSLQIGVIARNQNKKDRCVVEICQKES